MKKIYYLRLWLIAAMLSVAYSASAYNAEVDGIYYNLNKTDRTAEVTSRYGKKYSGDINIPSVFVYGGIKYTVVSIGDDAFSYCTGLTSITIPNSVTSIGESAFWNCTGLTSITIPNSVTSIGAYAFEYCTGLTSITIPNSVTSIGNYTFSHCTGLTSITIPNSVTSISEYAFSYCTGLTSITISDSVTSIGEHAFEKCTGLKEVHISDLAAWCRISFGYSDSNPLYYAHNLYLNDELITDLVIPNSVTSIRERAFKDCTCLTSITIPNSVTSIGGGAFSNCNGLTSITIPNSVTSIGEAAFRYCTGLTSITIPNSVTSIGAYAFEYCTGLTSITIPNSVTSIGNYTFSHCTGLTSITISNSVTSIGKYAFDGCTGISKITIPKTVKQIDSNAFACNDELEVYVEWDDPSDKTPTIAQQPFSDNIMQYGTLYVPKGTKALYEQCDPWRNFFNIEEYTPSGIDEIEANAGVTISVEGGKIAVAGAEDAKVEVFGTNGAAVYSGSADNLPELAAGIYIVRIGSTVKKVAIAK